mmetsp:Transcript_18627/g.35487  ORF Transcript_18627/g.35487 Transcript_18627/m.35487 type:complete len:222 (-) Transcript_18627:4-669(-)
MLPNQRLQVLFLNRHSNLNTLILRMEHIQDVSALAMTLSLHKLFVFCCQLGGVGFHELVGKRGVGLEAWLACYGGSLVLEGTAGGACRSAVLRVHRALPHPPLAQHRAQLALVQLPRRSGCLLQHALHHLGVDLHVAAQEELYVSLHPAGESLGGFVVLVDALLHGLKHVVGLLVELRLQILLLLREVHLLHQPVKLLARSVPYVRTKLQHPPFVFSVAAA